MNDKAYTGRRDPINAPFNQPTPIKLTKGQRCCCGHNRKHHGQFVNGTNNKGSTYVCHKDNCNLWNQCNLA